MFDGTLDVLSRFTLMEQLLLDDNFFTGDLSFVRNMTRLTVIQVSYNEISGPLTYFGNFTNLYAIDLRRNLIADTLISGGLFNLPALTNLYLQSNLIKGVASDISTVIQRMPLLKTLNVADNQLSGTFSFDSTVHKNLMSLQVSHNHFKDYFTVHFPDLTRKFILDIDGSSFFCPFPVLPSTVMVQHDACRTPWLEYFSQLGTRSSMPVFPNREFQIFSYFSLALRFSPYRIYNCWCCAAFLYIWDYFEALSQYCCQVTILWNMGSRSIWICQ
jgi:hypothetical protein